MSANGVTKSGSRCQGKWPLWVRSRDFLRIPGNVEEAPLAAVPGPQWNREARPSRDILATPADHRVGQKAVIRLRLLDMPTARSRQLIEQPVCFFQIGSVEPLGEPAVGGRKKFARFGPTALFAP